MNEPPRAELRSTVAFVVCGGILIVAGGVVAAVNSAAPFAHGSWLAAYLVLVGGTAQILLAGGYTALLVPGRACGQSRSRLLLWNFGSLAVPTGVLGDTAPWVTAGSVALLCALALFAGAASGARRARAIAYLALVGSPRGERDRRASAPGALAALLLAATSSADAMSKIPHRTPGVACAYVTAPTMSAAGSTYESAGYAAISAPPTPSDQAGTAHRARSSTRTAAMTPNRRTRRPPHRHRMRTAARSCRQAQLLIFEGRGRPLWLSPNDHDRMAPTPQHLPGRSRTPGSPGRSRVRADDDNGRVDLRGRAIELLRGPADASAELDVEPRSTPRGRSDLTADLARDGGLLLRAAGCHDADLRLQSARDVAGDIGDVTSGRRVIDDT